MGVDRAWQGMASLGPSARSDTLQQHRQATTYPCQGACWLLGVERVAVVVCSCAVTVDLCHIPPIASLQLDVTTFATWRFSFAIVAFATVTTRKAWLVKNRGKGSEWNGEREEITSW